MFNITISKIAQKHFFEVKYISGKNYIIVILYSIVPIHILVSYKRKTSSL